MFDPVRRPIDAVDTHVAIDKRKVVLTPTARDDADRIDSWWRANRRAAPWLFGEELAASLALLEVAPEMGSAASHGPSTRLTPPGPHLTLM